MRECPRCGASLIKNGDEKLCEYCGYRYAEDEVTIRIIRTLKMIELTGVLRYALFQKQRKPLVKNDVAKTLHPKRSTVSKVKAKHVVPTDKAAHYRSMAQNARYELSAAFPVFSIIGFIAVAVFWHKEHIFCFIPILMSIGLPFLLLITGYSYTKLYEKGDYRRALNMKQVLITLKVLIIIALLLSLLISTLWII